MIEVYIFNIYTSIIYLFITVRHSRTRSSDDRSQAMPMSDMAVALVFMLRIFGHTPQDFLGTWV